MHEGHLGMDKYKIRARQSIFWPGINKQIEDLISKCDMCIRNRRAQEKEPFIPHPVLRSSLEKMDYFSKFPEIAHLTDTKTETVIRKLKSHITSSPLHSKSNGLVERSVQTIKNLINKARQGDEDPFFGTSQF
ncbi:hypothetical protein LAZ67_3005896 [Cordylochernes scorpioides]|uniref:RNA-directed DNA polymerase n=1 Tax=Cordylochernes scorpioides TaxID=51811 RepID=A0ABY6KDQ9_9ARAC|nr:hypothetical protein LAZ67_3005896 [Cordylochernes scorpioides]